MERNKRSAVLFLYLAVLYFLTLRKVQGCPRQPDKTLPCYSDYNKTITCEWKSTYEEDNDCTLQADGGGSKFRYNSSCDLKPVDASRPALKKCSMSFKRDETFQTFHNLSVKVICNPVKKTVSRIFFKPSCHIKLDRPPQPKINFTTVSLVPPDTKKRHKIRSYNFQLQWKHADESWVCKHFLSCDWNCMVKLLPNLLIQGERYEARARVKAVAESTDSVWSEWSPTTSWTSLNGRTKPYDPIFIPAIITCLVVLVLLLAVISLKRNKTIWIFLVTKIKGQPIPNPAESFLKSVNFQNYLSPQLTTIFKQLDIASIEITSPLDVIAPFKPEGALLEKMRSEGSFETTSSSYSNPSYAHLCPAPPLPVSSLTAGNLDPCGADTPYGPVCRQSDDDKDAGQERGKVRGKDLEILEQFSKSCKKGEPVTVISDYERVEKLQVERSRLQSLDSGVCSCEEVSQESLEADSINVSECHDEEREEEEEVAGKGKDGVFQRLFGGSVDIFGKDSIQVCSDYERVQKLEPDDLEIQHQNSGVKSQTEKQLNLDDVSKSTESTNLLFSLPPCSRLCSFSPSIDMSSNFTGPAGSPGLCSNILVLMSGSMSVRPSSDGYMPVRQEER
ncbi:uncharacterized protein LOC117815733 [Xyrichtys novacula]|uniref:Uncharacterized protein LOC117815733 n=1 Tax=Xyrichtys novacula TaxID=13765 RepID=A0AAV1EWV7_XYRNO|nr:uncharacterized protein LOC117815733 [Xyrichtys novacula]